MEGASDDIDLQEMLQLQLSEVELLSSMYPNDGELVLDDPMAVPEIQDYVDGKIPYDNVQSRIGFTVKIQDGSEKVCVGQPWLSLTPFVQICPARFFVSHMG